MKSLISVRIELWIRRMSANISVKEEVYLLKRAEMERAERKIE